MSVLEIEKYKQKNGEDILKVILKSTKVFPNGACFYCDSCDEELIRSYTWGLLSQKHPYVIAGCLGMQQLCFHREKAFNILGYYPDYINHIDGIEYDNVNINLDVMSQQQNLWCRPSKGYGIVRRSFQPQVMINSQQVYTKCVRTEVEACQLAYLLEIEYEDYHYDFMKDRRHDLDLLDMERTGKISEDEAIYYHVLRYAADNAWYYYRYNLAEYFAVNNLKIPSYSLDSDGYMTHSITGQRLCPL